MIDARMFTVGPVAENCFVLRTKGSDTAVLIDPEAASARAVIGALNAAPIVLGDAAALFGGRVTGDFKAQFDARIADAILIKAGMANKADRHIHVTVLRRAINEAAA